MQNDYSKSNVLTSLFWKFLERGGTQVIQFMIQIILARLLSPKDFGALAIVLVFINIGQVFIESGFNTALIQKKDADQIDFSSVFYLSIFISGIMYSLIFIATPTISNYYDNLDLTPILRTLSLILFPGALNSIQNAYVAKNLLFKKLFKSSLISMATSGLTGIILAYQGYGIWALVFQQLINHMLLTFIMWFTIKWRPSFVFSLERIKSLFSFGWKILLSSLMNILYIDIRTLIIGGMFSPSVLGYYNKGQQFPRMLVDNINNSMQSVMLPTLSAYQDTPVKFKLLTRRAIKSSSFFIFPMMIGLAIIAEPLVIILLTDKWISAVPFLQIFCFSYILWPIHTVNLQSINAMGRSDLYLKLEVFKKIIGLIILFLTIPFNVYIIALGQSFNSLISAFINAYPNKKLLNYTYKEQMLDVFNPLKMSVFMGIVIYLLKYIGLKSFPLIVLQFITGIVIYILMAKVTKDESFQYLLTTIQQFKHRSET